jgi:hypothetical protein
VKRKNARYAALLVLFACSRLNTLTPELLAQAEARWNRANIGSYQLEVEMKGDRLEKALFEVTVRSGQVVSLKRNGQAVQIAPDRDYSIPGLFRTLHQELDLVKKPVLLGAPEGYTAYPMAAFDGQNGRLVQYRRTVGGASNTIDIRVVEFKVL